MKTSFLSLRLLCVLTVCLILAQPLRAQDKDKWLPLDPQDLAATKPQVEPDADAEVLLWEVRVEDTEDGVKSDNYIRLKIFTERGRELNSKIFLSYGQVGRFSTKIEGLTARTITPDGNIIEVKSSDIFESDQIRRGQAKIKAKSFALPNLLIGSIIEYRWREVTLPYSVMFSNSYARLVGRPGAEGERFEIQREIPVRRVTYYIKPRWKHALTGKVFNWSQQPDVIKQGDEYTFTLKNLPAFRVEPYMPPTDQGQAWFMYYQRKEEVTASSMLSYRVRENYLFGEQLEAQANDKDFKKAVEAIVGDAVEPTEKLRRIFAYCRDKIRNLSDPAQHLTEEEQKKLRKDFGYNLTLLNIFRLGVGQRTDINALFAMMALSVGLDAHLVMVPERRQAFFDFSFPRPNLLVEMSTVAVKLGEEWYFFQPGNLYSSFTRLGWESEGVTAIVPQEKDGITVKIPLSTADESQTFRTARFTLTENGTLEGDAEITYSGHDAVSLKKEYIALSPIERERDWLAGMKQRLGAEVTQFKMDNIAINSDPVKISFHLRTTNYAQRTGKRMFLPTAVFQYGVATVFPASQRKYAIYFPYAWQETDNITFLLPAGYGLDETLAPHSLGSSVIDYQVQWGHTPDQKQLSYRRHFVMGVGPQKSLLLYGPGNYPTLKKLFDDVHQKDQHVIVLRRNE